jgi:hypothetical protein
MFPSGEPVTICDRIRFPGSRKPNAGSASTIAPCPHIVRATVFDPLGGKSHPLSPSALFSMGEATVAVASSGCAWGAESAFFLLHSAKFFKRDVLK